MRLEPIAVYILERFSEKRTSSLRLIDVIESCTESRRGAIRGALEDLADRHNLIKRTTPNDIEMIELTDAGRSYVGLAAADMAEHVHTA